MIIQIIPKHGDSSSGIVNIKLIKQMCCKHSGGIAFASEYYSPVTVIGSKKRRNHFLLLCFYSIISTVPKTVLDAV